MPQLPLPPFPASSVTPRTAAAIRKYSQPAPSEVPADKGTTSTTSVPSRKYSTPAYSSSSSAASAAATNKSTSGDYFARKYSLGNAKPAPKRTPSSEEESLGGGGLDPFAGMPALEDMPKGLPGRGKENGGYEGSVSKFGGHTFGGSSRNVDVTSLLGKSSGYDSASLIERDRESKSTSNEEAAVASEESVWRRGFGGVQARQEEEEVHLEEEETKIPCEFCEELIPIVKLISHQVSSGNLTQLMIAFLNLISEHIIV